MLYEALEILREQVAIYINDSGLGSDKVSLDSITHFIDNPNTDDEELDNKVILSLLNLQEESSLKNQRNFAVQNGNPVYKNNPVHLNAYVLFTCNRNDYAFSLRSLAAVIEYFQGKKIFNHKNTVFTRNTQIMQAVKEFNFTIELYTPSFEELNYIWSMLGGKAYPAAVYKINLINIEREHIANQGALLTQINTTYIDIN
ncbi:putative protein DUF4255 [Leeuwenhoekiella aestuarii]|uniref:Pvc16 N-terminal domain-containing protein n=1 Tax=Leeuwenhoekiella aestuarii TaxID=2249426 RepID=A0A4Q0NPA6_9FLAO|nr:DUF4255 domain-containing protein [Leeuwenhoekiella aestuarii]RXG11980.1 putative protein DUF4255 [Leeuwenhoekiella aestuarii]RXG13538.1 putative protein DUF4255 [Leeuwenhoekiella aestuarii]